PRRYGPTSVGIRPTAPTRKRCSKRRGTNSLGSCQKCCPADAGRLASPLEHTARRRVIRWGAAEKRSATDRGRALERSFHGVHTERVVELKNGSLLRNFGSGALLPELPT